MHRKLLFAFLAIVAIGLIFAGPGCDELVTESTTTIVYDYPEAEFNANKREGCAPCTVRFTEESNGPVEQWQWTIRFADSIVDSSRDTNPTFIFEEPGFYSVSLLVTDTLDRTDSETKTRYVLVANPVPAFQIGGGGGVPVCAGTKIEFINESYGGITDYKWMFYTADSSFIDSTYRSNPDYTFSQPGLYSVSLTVSSDCGDSTVVLPDAIDVRSCALVDWTVNGGTTQDTVCGLEDITIDFTISGGTVDSILWIGTGNDTARGSISPVTFPGFETGGLKSIWNRVYTEGLVTSDTLSQILFVESLAEAALLATQTDSSVSTVTFTATNSTNANTYFWDFGDGNNGSGIISTHAYDTAGTYDVFLVVDNACNVPDTAFETIEVFDSTSTFTK